jgi:acetolactate synthase, large subunit (EC 2.2.1.6)
LAGLAEEVAKIKDVDWKAKHEAWNASLTEMRAAYPLSYVKNGPTIKPQWVVEKIFELSKGEAIIATEVGQNQMWAAQFFTYRKPRTLLTSGGLGTMGYGFPAAIGAQFAFPDKLVVDIAGDGSIQMNIQELATAVSYNVPVKIVILNNGYSAWSGSGRNFSTRRITAPPACTPTPISWLWPRPTGPRASSSRSPKTLTRPWEAFAYPGPVIVDVRVEPEENVAPMVPAGAPCRKCCWFRRPP